MPSKLIQRNLLKVVLGDYVVGPATCIGNPGILPEVQQYKRLVASQLIPLARQDILRKIPDGPTLVSRKLDGEFNAVVYREGEAFLVNPGGMVRIGLPLLDELKSLLHEADVADAILAGELYLELEPGSRCRIHDVLSVLRHPDDQQQLEKVRFGVFDWIQLDQQKLDQSYSEKWRSISQVFQTGKLVHPVETKSVSSVQEIEGLFQNWVEESGGEGIVVRSDSAGSFKAKPLFNLDAVVIGFTESTDERAGMLHDLLLAVTRRDGALHVLCRVGGGFSDDLRRTMLSDLQDMVVDSEYAEVNSDHVAYQMVRPEMVIEISCLDLVAQNTRGRPVNRMTLRWENSENQYKVIRRLPLVSVISPQFLRVREDKSATKIEDSRIQQLDAIVPIPFADADTTQLSLPKSQLMQREVYVKTLRGEQLVRKFLLWKTNKETDSENFPAYVAYHADFSPSRKVPLTREVRVSNSETQILALWHDLKENNIKAGWELVGDKNQEIEKIVSATNPENDKTTKIDDAKSVGRNKTAKKTTKKATKKKEATKKNAKKSAEKTSKNSAKHPKKQPTKTNKKPTKKKKD